MFPTIKTVQNHLPTDGATHNEVGLPTSINSSENPKGMTVC